MSVSERSVEDNKGMKARLFGLVSLFGLAGAAQALLIDDFSDGNVNLVVTNGAGLASLDPATALGSSRATWIGQSTFTGDRSSTLNISGGSFSVDNSIGTSSRSSIGYGVSSVHNGGGFGTNPNSNFNLSAFDTYRFHFEGNDQPLTIFISLFTDGGVNGLVLSKSVAGGQLAPFVFDVTLADVFGSFGSYDLSDVDQLRFDFSSSNAGDFALSHIEAVPEPATMAILGLGLAAIARRRRK
jgi:hypothetical protein